MNRTLCLFKDAIEFIYALVYGILLSCRCRKPCRIVIYYHSLKAEEAFGFERQMRYLARHFSVKKASELVTDKLNGTRLQIAITFDDAFSSVYENALPILRKYGLPASIFVPTGKLGEPPDWPLEKRCHDADEIVMSPEQLAALQGSGCEAHSHTVSHPRLTEIDDDALTSELVGSKSALERIVGHKVSAISYPYGAYDKRVCEAARRAGYKIGYSIEPCLVDVSPDNFQIGRFMVSPKENMLKFKLKVRGAYQGVKYLRRFKRIFVRAW